MTIDVIILSYVKNEDIFNMNLECISSLISSTEKHEFNIILIETEPTKTYNYPFKNVKVIQPNIDFNYNKFLNIGLKECKNEWVLISNNDTIYHKDFLEEMLIANSEDNELLSMSPMDDSWNCHKTFDKNKNIHYGYRTSYEIAGWSILAKKTVFDVIGNLDEQFDFWYQDNDYAESLSQNNIKHGLITNSKVTHLVSKSHDLVDKEKIDKMTRGASYKFFNKWR